MSVAVKICGLKTPETIAAALDAGASHVGFIFFEKSPRHIEPELAGRLAKAAANRARTVAVTVDADDAALDAIFAAMRPDVFQLHGSETPQRVAEVRARYHRQVMKALSVGTRADLDRLRPYVGVADSFLFDARPPKGADLPGGNGVSFDWSILAALDSGLDYMLSGGLHAGNVGEALRVARPPAIDVSSGVERAPGVKDVRLIEAFFAAIRSAETQAA